MKFKITIAIILFTVGLSGCKTTPIYETKKLDSNFSLDMKLEKKISVVLFDSWVGDELNDSGGFGQVFSALGAILESESEEAFGINLQNESMDIINKELLKINLNYIPVNLMDNYSVDELNKRYKSNRAWTIGTIKNNELNMYFDKNKNTDYVIHIKSQAAVMVGTLFSETNWIIYNRSLNKVADIHTRSVEKLDGKKLTNDEQFKKIMVLQRKNISEFIKVISTKV